MIRITDTEKIKTKGDFKLDGLLIKKHYFDSKQVAQAKNHFQLRRCHLPALMMGLLFTLLILYTRSSAMI